jgi:PAS domain S-box-containing protein
VTWQTGVYFGAVLAALLVSGFLAWQAWRQRAVLSNQIYFWLALVLGLAALQEVFLMLSPNEALALFWFKTRFLPFAALFPLWLLFALEYSGRRAWFSKTFLGVLFIIPLITQAMVWTSGFHFFWVQQEVGFHQDGPFWIAETAVRVTGPWFLVHLFYGQLLLLAGSCVLLWSAWRAARRYRLQAVFLTASALVPFMITLLTVFNWLPQGAFNPAIPGFALGAALAAVAVFRFDFLKRRPQPAPSAGRLDPQEKRSQAMFLLTLAILATGLAVAGYLSYRNFERDFRAQVESQLSAIAGLKVSELQSWRAERLGDAQALQKNVAFAALVKNYLENPSDAIVEEQLQNWMENLVESYHYSQIYLLDTGGSERIAAPPVFEPIDAHMLEQVAPTLQAGQVVFLDFHFHQVDQSIVLSLLVPIYAGQDLGQPLGILVLMINPETYLYPYIVQWPTASESAETLLVRREGNEVVFLNPLRFRKDAALTLGISMEETRILAAKAALGQSGVVEGIDYRGQAVVGAIAPVPNSPWFLVARLDQDEAFAPLQERLWQTVIFFSALVVASGAGLYVLWGRQRWRYRLERYQAAEALRASEEKFKKAFMITPDAVSITRLSDGRFASINQGFERILGFSEQEVLGNTSIELGIWDNLVDREKIVAVLQSGDNAVNFESQFRSKDGAIHQGLLSAALIEIDGEQYILNTVRDITERKRAEDALRESEERFRTLVEQAPTVIFVQTRKKFAYINPAGLQLFGVQNTGQLLGQTVTDYFHLACREQVNVRIRQLNEERKAVPMIVEKILRLDGSSVDVEESAVPFFYGGEHGALVFVQDITERIQAEQALKESRKLLEDITDNSASLVYALDLEGRFLLINRALETLFGVPRQTLISKTRQAILPAEIAESHRANDLHVIESRQPYMIEEENEQPDGKHIYLSIKFPLVASEDDIYGVGGISTDITDLKKADAERELLFNILAASLNEIYVFDADTLKFRFVNSGALKNLLIDFEQARQLTPLDIKPQFTPEDFEQVLGSLLRREKTVQVFETVHRRMNGDLYPVEVHLQYFEKEHAFLAVIQDITERKQSEESLKAYSERLEEMVEERTLELRDAQEKLVRQERLAVLVSWQAAWATNYAIR